MSKTAATLSLRSKDAIESGGLFGPGEAEITAARWDDFEYKKKGQTRGTTAQVLLVEYDRDGETATTPYGIGNGWKIGKGNQELIPRNGQTGLPNNCNAMHFIMALEDAGMPEDFLERPEQLVGLKGTLILKPIERDFGEDGIKKKSILVFSDVDDAPWDAKGGKSKAKPKGISADDDDEDEKPKSKSGKKVVDDDDEDEAPAKGKKKPSADADDEDVDEAAVEALVDALEEDEKIKIANLEAAILARLPKKTPNRAEIAARCTEADFLDQEKGWSIDGKYVVLNK